MTTLQKVAGNTGAPVPGNTSYQNDLLINSALHFVIIDNVPQNGLNPTPDYTFDTITGTFDFSPNTFQVGTKIIFVYAKCNCN